jgi:hypothetical protein
MKLLKFTRTSPQGAEVAINPEFVVSVTKHNDKTAIHLAAPGGDSNLTYHVAEDFSFVVSRLQGIATS